MSNIIKCFCLIIFFGSTSYPQEEFNTIRDIIADINISFYDNKLPNKTELDSLVFYLNKNKENIFFRYADDELKNFVSLLVTGERTDTLKIAFRAINNKFNTGLGAFFYDRAMKSNKTKILVFSTSMSCECTMEMCYKQEAEVEKFVIENPGIYEYAVINTWADNQIQDMYEIGFVPAILVLDQNANVIQRFTMEENLTNFLKKLKGEN